MENTYKDAQQNEPQRAPAFGKKDVLRGTLFCVLFVLILVLLNALFYDDSEVCTTWDDIYSGNGPELLIMGNSHAFTAYIPDIISDSLGVSCGIVGTSAENMSLTVQNLRSVLNNYTPRAIILEPFCVSLTGRYLISNNHYVLNDIDGMQSPVDKLRAMQNNLVFDDVPPVLSQLFRSSERWSRWSFLIDIIEGNSKPVNIYKQADIHGYVAKNDYTGGSIVPEDVVNFHSGYSKDVEPKIEDSVNEQSLIEFLTLAQEHDISVYILLSPSLHCTDRMMSSYLRVEQIAQDFPCVKLVHDYHLDEVEIGLQRTDFYDIGHLNRRGSVKFTQYMIDNEIASWFDTTPNYDQAFFYRTEEITDLNNGQYRYTMEAFGTEVQYKFSLKGDNGKYTVYQDWSTANSVDLAIPPDDANRVRVSMLPADIPTDQANQYALVLTFMTQNKSYVEAPE